MNRVRIVAIGVWLLMGPAVFSQNKESAVWNDSIKTIAGEFRITEKKISEESSCKFDISFNGKIILQTDCTNEKNEYAGTPIPIIHTYYKASGVRPFDEVILLQFHMTGNACNGGPFVFIGLKENKTFKISKAIDYCGGPSPIVTWSDTKVTLFVPGGPPNRGAGYIPPETWIYENGLIKKGRSTKK